MDLTMAFITVRNNCDYELKHMPDRGLQRTPGKAARRVICMYVT